MSDHATRGILFVDLDGTLVGPDGVAERVWPALAALRIAGWRVAVCTGRPGRGIALDIARRLDPEGLHVFESGAVVMRCSGEVLVHHALAPDVVTRLVAIGQPDDATLEAYTADARYLARERNAVIIAHEALLGFDAEIIPWPPIEPLVRVQWVVPPELWQRLQPATMSVTDIAVHEGRSPRMPGVSFVSMTRAGVSKGTAVQSVLALLGLARERAAMVGDNLNDIEGFHAVGRAFVAADGAAAAIAVADHIVPGAAEGGVADAAAWLLARG